MIYNYYKCSKNIFKFSLMVLTIIFYGSQAHAQVQEPCGTDALMEELYQQHPEFRKIAERNFEESRNSEREIAQRGTAQKVIVPVVVHVVHKINRPAQRVPIFRVKQQIARLNADFQRLNSDTVNTPAIFRPIAGAAPFEFRLALIDPAGNPTNGITYTETNVDFGGSGEYRMKFDSTGGHNAWNVGRYLNIWVCELGDPGLGGYAFLAEASPQVGDLDGLVIKYSLFNGSNRTTTHEAGHYFGLRHTFQDGCHDNNSCSSLGDRICDTPPQILFNSGAKCNSNYNSCNETPDMPDNYSNYMDYTPDYCQNMFTQGQVTLMQGVVGSIRFPLVLNPQQVVGPLNLVANDAVIFKLLSPTANACQAPVYPSFRMRNYGTETINTASISYKIDNLPTKIYKFTGALAPTELTEVVLSRSDIGPGNHTLQISIDSVNGAVDGNVENSVLSFNFNISGSEVNQPSYLQGFECVANIAAKGWNLMNSTSNGQWERTEVVSGHGQSRHSIVRKFYLDRQNEKGQRDRLVTPLFDLTGVNNDAEVYLKYSYSYVVGGTSKGDTLRIYVSKACGTLDTLVRTKSGYGTNKTSTLGTAAPFRFSSGSQFIPTESEWLTDSIDLSTFIKEGYINIVFEAVSNSFSTLYLDDIAVISTDRPIRQDCADRDDLVEGDFILYPNPGAASGGMFFLETSKELEGPFEVQVFNAMGASVASYPFTSGTGGKQLEFILPELSVGVYFVRLSINGEAKETYRLILRKDG